MVPVGEGEAPGRWYWKGDEKGVCLGLGHGLWVLEQEEKGF